MKPSELDELKMMEQAATPSPWTETILDERYSAFLGGICGPDERVCDFGSDEQYDATSGNPPSDADMDLILAARNALPRLLAEREMLLEALRDAAAEIECGPTGDSQFAREAIAKAES